MERPATQIVLTQHETNQLVSMSRKPKIQAQYALRAQLILKAAKGVSGLELAKQLGVLRAFSASGGCDLKARAATDCWMTSVSGGRRK